MEAVRETVENVKWLQRYVEEEVKKVSEKTLVEDLVVVK